MYIFRLLHSERYPIPDVPAVYFISPTHENVARICEDLEKGLYDSYYVNFSSVVTRDLLEHLAQSALKTSSYEKIAQVYDQYLNYLCLEQSMFSLNLRDSYLQLNQATASDSQIESFMKQIVSRLHSVFITTGQVPVIRAPRGNAAESVALTLESRLRDHVRNAKQDAYMDQNGLPTSRPLLIILDRNMDVGTMLHHTWSYQCLAHDIFDMKANRIIFNTMENGSETKKVYDIDLKDFFWAKNACSPFPEMAANVDTELNDYKKQVEEITRKCGVSSLEEISSTDPGSSAMHLKAAVSSLPALTERKRTIDMHMNIASALLKVIKDRCLDSFIVTEETIYKQTKASMMEIITNKDKGAAEDKLRTFVLFYLNSGVDLSKADVSEFENALANVGCDLSVVRYVKQIKSIIQMNSVSQVNVNAGRNAANFLSNLPVPGFGGAIDSLISGVRNIIPTKQNLPILSIVNALTEASGLALGTSSTGNPDDEYMYLDPMSSQSKKPTKATTKALFQEIYVFVVGGGNYVEYQNLQEYCKTQNNGRKIIYGSTEICNPSTFLSQLSQLGRQVSK